MKAFIDQLFRKDAIIGNGGAADILRFETETGISLSKHGHVEKVSNAIKFFQTQLDSGHLSAKDSKIAQELLNDLAALEDAK